MGTPLLCSQAPAPEAPSAAPARVRRVRGSLLGNRLEGFRPPQNGLPFGSRASAILHPAASCRRVLRSDGLTPVIGFGPVSLRIPHHCCRAPETDAASFLELGPSGPTFQNAGRLHVNVG